MVVPRRRRRRKKKSSFLPTVVVVVASLFSFVLLLLQFWLGVMLHTAVVDQQLLFSTAEQQQQQPHDNPTQQHNMDDDDNNDNDQKRRRRRFLIFRHVHTGQGTGNVMNGLLAAYLLGREFDRTVCVEDFTSFQAAFEHTRGGLFQQQQQQLLCAAVQRRHPPTANITIDRSNYDNSNFESECLLQDQLSSPHLPVLYYTGNTYPRWPGARLEASASEEGHNKDFFREYYQPTQALQSLLSWNINSSSGSSRDPRPPTTVVHLRQPDGALDARPGLDNRTLWALGNELSRKGKTFLVTNNVEWYTYFQKHFQWSHPPWSMVQHSALHIQWGKPHQQQRQDTTSKEQRDLQMWADWYTLLCAKRAVYHTPSDFSASAVRWNHGRRKSWTILGSTTTTMSGEESSPRLLVEEDFVDDKSSLPKALVDRVGDELQFCHPHLPGKFTKVQVDARMHVTMALLAQRRRNRRDNTFLTTTTTTTTTARRMLRTTLVWNELWHCRMNTRQNNELLGGESV